MKASSFDELQEKHGGVTHSAYLQVNLQIDEVSKDVHQQILFIGEL